MIDLAGLASLFFEASKEWTEPNAVRLNKFLDIKREPEYQRLGAEGHEFIWASESKLRLRAREGWRPVTERDMIGRPTVFMERKSGDVILHRPKA